VIETIKKIIITRDRDRAAPLIAALEPYGILSRAVPVTRTVFDVSKTITEDLDEYNCIAFTSANAVEAFAFALKNSGVKPKQGLKIFAVGSSTAAIAERVFRKPDLVPEKSDAATLAEAITKNTVDPASLRIFWPCAVEALPDFEKILAEAGAYVTRRECYRTVALDPKHIKSELGLLAPWDLVFFAAPGAVKAFSRAWEDKTGFIAVAIGPTTEKALFNAGYDKVVTSKGTSVNECAGTIVDALQLKVWS
jgi:uroporphyrinogen-III synthase